MPGKGEMQGEWNVLQLTLSIGSMEKVVEEIPLLVSNTLWRDRGCAKEMARAFWLRLRIRTELIPLWPPPGISLPCITSLTSFALVVGLSNFDVSHQAAPCA